MAERRMFAKTIIDSDAFLEMPVPARLLYYDLAMRADDDGFVNSPKKIMRFVGASESDLSILAKHKFIIPFESGVVVIKHWKIHNYIRKDTYSPTKYHDEFSRLLLDENSAYKLSKTDVENSYVTEPSTTRQRSVDDPSTQDRLGKDRIGKDKKESKKEKTSSFDKIIAQYSTDEKTVELLKEWLKVRKAKRAAMTDKAIQMNVDKLDGIAKESGMDVNAYLSEVICRGWAALYPIRQYGDKQTGKTYGANGIEIDPNGARDLDEIF